MRIVEWSGHPFGDVPGAAASGRMPARSQILGPGADPDKDPDQHHLASRLLDPLAARRARQLAHAEDLHAAGSTDANELKGARKSGAKWAASYLNGPLGDDWVMFRGYRNARGPIGGLLLGPRGLVAMTSLYLDAEVHCRGDKWHAEKRPGNASGATPRELSLLDPEGRSPSVQLNQAADLLEEFLHTAGVRLKVQRVVLLNHPRQPESELHRPTVRVFDSRLEFSLLAEHAA